MSQLPKQNKVTTITRVVKPKQKQIKQVNKIVKTIKNNNASNFKNDYVSSAPVATGHRMGAGMYTTSSKDKTTAFGREYLGPIITGTDPVPGQNLLNIDVNPTYFEGTRLQLLARTFEKYLFRKLRFIYVSGCSSNTSGTIGIAYDKDVSDPTPPATDAGVREYLSYEDAVMDRVWTDVELNIRKPDFGFDYLFTSESSAGDPRLAYQGQIYVFQVVNPPASIAIGSLFIDYECEFITPQLENQTTGYLFTPQTGQVYGLPVVNSATNTNSSTSTQLGNFVSSVQAGVGSVIPYGRTLQTIVDSTIANYSTMNAQAVKVPEGYYQVDQAGLLSSYPAGATHLTFKQPITVANSINPTNPSYTEIIDSHSQTSSDGQIDRSDLVFMPPGGGILGSLGMLQALGVTSGNTGATVAADSLNLNITPVSYKVAQALINYIGLVNKTKKEKESAESITAIKPIMDEIPTRSLVVKTEAINNYQGQNRRL